jgi:hypothetical protein
MATKTTKRKTTRTASTAKATIEQAGAVNPPVLSVYPPNPSAAQVAAASQAEHAMMAVRAVSNLVTLNSTPG